MYSTQALELLPRTLRCLDVSGVTFSAEELAQLPKTTKVVPRDGEACAAPGHTHRWC